MHAHRCKTKIERNKRSKKIETSGRNVFFELNFPILDARSFSLNAKTLIRRLGERLTTGPLNPAED